MPNLTIVWVLETGVHVVLVIVIIEHVATVHAATFTWFFGRTFGWWTLAVAGCCRFFAGRPAVRVALGLTVVPCRLQASVRGLQVSHRQHALDGLLCTGGCRWLAKSPSTHKQKNTIILVSSCQSKHDKLCLVCRKSSPRNIKSSLSCAESTVKN